MRIIVPVAMLLSATTASAQVEDAAHRADRLRTQALNRAAAAVVDRRQTDDARKAAAYRTARAKYERRLAEHDRRAAARSAADPD